MDISISLFGDGVEVMLIEAVLLEAIMIKTVETK